MIILNETLNLKDVTMVNSFPLFFWAEFINAQSAQVITHCNDFGMKGLYRELE